MKIRRTEEKDIKRMMEIVGQAQQYMREQGIDQWQNGYPTEEVFEKDVENQMSYVLEEDENVIGMFAFAVMEEPTYREIYEGQWKQDGDYGVIHRVAVDNQFKGAGLGGKMVEYAVNACLAQNIKTLRIDTHRDNRSMQNMLCKNGFERRGIIYLADGAERIAFEKECKKTCAI